MPHWHACPYCYYESDSRDDLRDHQNECDHFEWCEPCSRPLYSPNSYDQHINTSAAHGTVVARCQECNRGFTSYPNLMLHQERSSRCRYLANHAYDTISQLDMFRNLTIEEGPYTDRNVRIQYSSTDRARNHRTGQWECFCGHPFATRRRLDQHLGSGCHDARNFACPAPECRRAYSELSALMQHIMRRSCRFGAFGIVQQALQNNPRMRRQIGL